MEKEKTNYFKKALSIAINRCKLHNRDLISLEITEYGITYAIFKMSYYKNIDHEYREENITIFNNN